MSLRCGGLCVWTTNSSMTRQAAFDLCQRHNGRLPEYNHTSFMDLRAASIFVSEFWLSGMRNGNCTYYNDYNRIISCNILKGVVCTKSETPTPEGSYPACGKLFHHLELDPKLRSKRSTDHGKIEYPAMQTPLHSERHAKFGKIKGTNEERIFSAPWVVMLYYISKNSSYGKKNQYSCHGVIIGREWILINAHSIHGSYHTNYIMKNYNIFVKVGADHYSWMSGVTHTIKRFYSPEEHRNNHKNPILRQRMRDAHDYALLQLNEPIPLDCPQSRALCMTDEDYNWRWQFQLNTELHLPNMYIHAINTHDTDIYKRRLFKCKVFTIKFRNERFAYVRHLISINSSEIQLIGESRTGCQFDSGTSGAPLVIYKNGRWVLLGIIKGQATSQRHTGNHIFLIDIYRLAYPWIKQVMGGKVQDCECFISFTRL